MTEFFDTKEAILTEIDALRWRIAKDTERLKDLEALANARPDDRPKVMMVDKEAKDAMADAWLRGMVESGRMRTELPEPPDHSNLTWQQKAWKGIEE